MVIGSQTDIREVYSRRDIDMATASAAEPTHTATWQPSNGPVETLARANAGDVYWACVKHFQVNYRE